MAAASFGISISMKENFFDRMHVIDKIGEANARAMSKALAFIQFGAQKSMKSSRTGKPAKPGKPPKRHFGAFNQGLGKMQNFFDPNSQSGIVGPIKFNSSDFISSAPTVPFQMEFGGTQTFRLAAYTKEWNRIDDDGMAEVRKKVRKRVNGRFVKSTEFTTTRVKVPVRHYRKSKSGKPKRIRVKSRPFMGPSLDRETANGHVLSSWGNEVHE